MEDTKISHMARIRANAATKLQHAYASAVMAIIGAKVTTDAAISASAESVAIKDDKEIEAMKRILMDAQAKAADIEKSVTAIQDEISAALAQM